MDSYSLPRWRAHIRASAQARRLAVQAQGEGEAGRAAAEQLARFAEPRPSGKLVWCHMPGLVEPGALESLRDRLEEDTAGVNLLISSPNAARCRRQVEAAAMICLHPPLDAPAICGQFLDHWRPDVGIWFEWIDAPILLETAARRAVPLFLQNAVAPEVTGTRSRNAQRRLLGLFERIFALDATEGEAIRSFGAIPSRIETTGRLAPIAQPPPCIESEREALADAIDGRPVWLAARPDKSELPVVLEAHRIARRTSHRLLLMLVPRDETDAPALARQLAAEGWNVARRNADQDPEEPVEIFLCDDPEELGLYYRLAPISFLGGTLSDTAVPPAIHPATLGSAIITGPFAGNEAEALRRLRRGGACRLVADAERLGSVVDELLAPDRAAQLALNAWDIASDGSQVLDRLVMQVQSVLRNAPDSV